jgi:CubicO group peptidase (beta-lactamase class C family)
VVHSAAYGVKQVGRAERVDRATRFMIASATKPLTTLMMASLVGRRMLDWDEPIAGKLRQCGLPRRERKLGAARRGGEGWEWR